MIRELIERLVAAGVDAIEAGEIIALAVSEGSKGASSADKRAARNRRYYDAKRLKASENVLNSTVLKPSESVLNRLNPKPSRVENNLPTEKISGKKENKNLVDLDFEAAWRFYPHRKGRSSKPKALIAWKALPLADRQRMLPAVKRYSSEGYEPKADCGAKAFELWLRDQRYLDWMDSEIASVARGPPDPEAQRRYLDYLKEINPDVSAAQ